MVYDIDVTQNDDIHEHLRILLKVWKEWNVAWNRGRHSVDRRTKETKQADIDALNQYQRRFELCIKSLWEENIAWCESVVDVSENPTWMEE
jgi:hypothetical protein